MGENEQRVSGEHPPAGGDSFFTPKIMAGLLTMFMTIGGGSSLGLTHFSLSSKLDDARKEASDRDEKIGKKLEQIDHDVGGIQASVAAAALKATEASSAAVLLTGRVTAIETEQAAERARSAEKFLELERRLTNMEGKK
jgi:hypothetical protein